MPEQYLHGVEVIEAVSGNRPIQTTKSSVIGIVGTAPDADATAFPLNTPVLISGNRTEAANLDLVGTGEGSLPAALAGIFDQVGAAVVVVRVDVGVDDAATQINVIGGIAGNGDYEGLEALLAAESVLAVQPRLICAPGFSDTQTVAAAMEIIADKLSAIAVVDCANTTTADAQTYIANFGDRVFGIYPWVTVAASGGNVDEPASARVCGVIAKTDNDLGFWHSPSNKQIKGIVGTSKPIDFKLGDATSRANVLNENNVATIIQQNGFRLWGNRTASLDPKWAFVSVRRTADIINDSLQRAHMWAVDRNITKNYAEEVAEGVNSYLRTLKSLGAIIGGVCWPDPDLNTPTNIQAGKIYFNFDFTVPSPAEKVTFTSMLVNDYYKEISES